MNKRELSQQLPDLASVSFQDLTAFAEGLGLPPYRARQIRRWIDARGATSFEEMTDLPKALREGLGARARIFTPPVLREDAAPDGTRKFLVQLEDGLTIESVLIPDKDRLTLCLSTQVGCPVNCSFCLTGRMGLVRNLASAEIVGQVRSVRARTPRRISNIVLMGMGEPLLNFENAADALRRLTDPRGFGFSSRRITLSTAGIVPGIERLGREGPPVNLAVSLNATTDGIRDRMIPINRKWPIGRLLAALRAYPLPPRRRITIEYVLLGGENDTDEDARRLAALLKGLRCKVNLIPFNPFPGSSHRIPDRKRVERFQRILTESRYSAFIRESRGKEIRAACGQLWAEEKKSGAS
ncbi:MAG: 23S rRNA (adenine(2503)-C(2))-methyltransferase RlmN [Nitrospirae bacterium]|nr:23S rRNA (adenine(2503)-C(2))-methyltransferase RlmN [Nitrospirota bacterium]